MNDIINDVKSWLQDFIITLGLCPFAAKPFLEDKISYVVVESSTIDDIYKAFLIQLDNFYSCPATEVETLLFIVPNGLTEFDDYLELLSHMEEAVVDSGLEGVIQLASFHPRYVFDGELEDAASNYTNRSPYPMFHFLREESLTKAIDNFDGVDKIPERNQQKMNALGIEKVTSMLGQYCFSKV